MCLSVIAPLHTWPEQSGTIELPTWRRNSSSRSRRSALARIRALRTVSGMCYENDGNSGKQTCLSGVIQLQPHQLAHIGFRPLFQRRPQNGT